MLAAPLYRAGAIAARRARLVHTSASPEEISHFAQLADSWWDPDGPQRILHKMNLMRMDYIRDTLSRFDRGIEYPGYSLSLLPASERAKYPAGSEPSGLAGCVSKLLTANPGAAATDAEPWPPRTYKFLDVGCGGGLLAESLARLGVAESVKGIDLTPDVLAVAKQHMRRDPALVASGKLSYELSGIENVPQSETYDVVTMFEMLEHVPRPAEVLRQAMDHVRPGGWLFLSTINRTAVAWLTTIFAGEHLLRIVPKGTHTWSKYINESELRDWLVTQPGWRVVRSDGCLFVPASGWHLTPNRSLGNYLLVAQRVD